MKTNDILYFVSIIFGWKVTLAARSCSAPDLPDHTIQITSYKITYPNNAYVRYKCKDGFYFQNGISRHKIACLDGTWKPQSFYKCTDKCDNRCGRHGHCEEVAGKYACHCDKNWTGPKCNTRVCDLPLLEDHMVRRLEYGLCNGDKWCQTGTKIQYTCTEGFEIWQGNSHDQCTDNGWQNYPEAALLPKCQPVSCHYKEFHDGTAYPMKQNYLRGEFVHFTCHEHYSLNIPNGISTCGSDGDWKPFWPTCTRNAAASCQHEGLLHGSFQPIRQFYDTGDIIRFTCYDGYSLNTPERISTCGSDGHWKPSWPKCTRNTEFVCPTPYPIHNGWKKQSSRLHLGSTVEYNCNTGYVLEGDETLHCVLIQKRPMWQGSPPTCISLEIFTENCANQNKRVVRKAKKIFCANVKNPVTTQPIVVTARSSSARPLTIVTATAGGLLLLLLIVITFVAFQRRRLSRHSRRRGRHRLSDDDRYAFLYYSNDFHLVLPSYDEAMQGRRPHPPPYNAAANNSADPDVDSSNNEQSTQLETGIEEHAYESIDQFLREDGQPSDEIEVATLDIPDEPSSTLETNNTTNATSPVESACSSPDEPIYSCVQKTNQGYEDSASCDSIDDAIDESICISDSIPLIPEDC